MRYTRMNLQLFCVLLASAETERKDKMADRKALQLFNENSPANQANVYEDATNLMPEEDDHVPAPSMPSAAGVVERSIGSLIPSIGGSMGGLIGASSGGICGAASAGASGFFAGSRSEKTQNKPNGVIVSTEKKS